MTACPPVDRPHVPSVVAGRRAGPTPSARRLDVPEGCANPELFERLVRVVGPVRVVNLGEKPRWIRETSPATGRPYRRLNVEVESEKFGFNCPICYLNGAERPDSRFRGMVRSGFGVRDEATGSLCLASACVNETQCLPEHARILWSWLFEKIPSEDKIYLAEHREQAWAAYDRGWAGRPGSDSDSDRRANADWRSQSPIPPGSIPFSDLDDDHPARFWLAERGFDPWELPEDRELLYVPAPNWPYLGWFDARIVIPIKNSNGEIVDATCRKIYDDSGEIEPKPKYLRVRGNRYRRGQELGVLYGIERQNPGDPIILVEGPTDAWRVGDCGVAYLNADLTWGQVKLLEPFAEAGSALIMLRDADMATKRPLDSASVRTKVEAMNKRLHGRLLVLDLPRDDPAEWLREDLFKFIHYECQQRGFRYP